MPRKTQSPRPEVTPDLAALERKKRSVLSQKAIERSRELISGARALIDRAKANKETARELLREPGRRRK